MRGTDFIVAGKDCEGCEHYIFDSDKCIRCDLKDQNKKFIYGQYIVCEIQGGKKAKNEV